MKSLYMKTLEDAGWTVHLEEPEKTAGYAAHRATGQIIYVEFFDGDDGDDDRGWEFCTALITKQLKFKNLYEVEEVGQ